MAEDIQLVKPDGQEWGFRVTGGVDFGTALTIVKINKGSTAERAGLKVGDMIVAINDQPLGPLTHFQATDAICKAGNLCKATVIRGSIVQLPQLPIPQIVLENGQTVENPEAATLVQDQEQVELPSVLANMINSGLQEQEAMAEGAGDSQQNEDADLEVAGSWNFSLPQQLVVTLKSVSPSLPGRPGSPWQIVEEYSTFVDQPDTSKDTSNTPLKIMTEINVGATEGGNTGVSPVPAGMVETLGKQGTQGQEAPAGSSMSEGQVSREQQQGDGAQTKQETKTGTTNQPEEEHKEYTDDEIAEMMSGCAEVLAGKCMGVDFHKLPPDNSIMNSEVLHALIAERIEYPQKKLTTFQQRPARPKPKPKGEPENPPEPYLPLKYKGNPKKVDSSKEEGASEQADSASIDENAVSPYPDDGTTESQHNPEETKEAEEGEQAAEHNEGVEEHEMVENAEHTDVTDNAEETQMPEDPSVVDSSDIEAQLAEIQNQLAAIIQLPVEIQQHLSFIQTQLSKIVEMRAAAEAKETEEHFEEETVHEGDEHQDGLEEEHDEGEEMHDHLAGEEGQEEKGEEEGGEEQEVMHPEPDSEAEPTEPEPEPEPELPKHRKDIQWVKEDEAQKRNKPFFPLTPQPRPVQLPGGRHWFKSRDVYTEDFIAETLSGKEEVIIGTTIGVDFRKFQYNLDHLKNSSVYKMVHGNEEKRVPGAFVNRAEKVLAKEDYVNP